MKVAMLVLFTVLAVSSALDMSIISYDNAHADKGTWRSDKEVMSMFEQWLVNQGKVYGALGEKKKRFQIFKDNLRFIDEHNSLNRTYKLGLTPFTDLTNEEFRAKYFGTLEEDPSLMSAKTSNHYAPRVGDNLPASVDWRTKGAVTQVKNQGNCQSCWAFSANGAVEGLNKIVTGNLVSLSEQELVDCDQGCDPGYIHGAFKYMIRNHGITAEAKYPYSSFNGVKGTCDHRKINPVVAIDNYAFAPRNDEAALKKAVANQPVSAAVEGFGPEFQNYVSGVFVGNCGTTVNHAILIVGYGSENGKDYWIIKNSWTSRWGEKGFMKLQRNVNKCGIASQPVYPIKNNRPMNAINNM